MTPGPDYYTIPTWWTCNHWLGPMRIGGDPSTCPECSREWENIIERSASPISLKLTPHLYALVRGRDGAGKYHRQLIEIIERHWKGE